MGERAARAVTVHAWVAVALVAAAILAGCTGAASQGGVAGPSAESAAQSVSIAAGGVESRSAAPSPVPSSAIGAAASQEPTTLIEELSARGLYCVECQLFWNAVGMSVLPPASPDPSAAAAGRRVWLQMRLSTATGGSITLADFAGRPVVLEMMATWCAACAEQQDTLRDVRPALPADAVIVSLSVDPREDAATLARYAAGRHYDWAFATGSVELLRSMGAELGDSALDPAGAPIVVIDRTGNVTLAPVGHKDVTAITALVGG